MRRGMVAVVVLVAAVTPVVGAAGGNGAPAGENEAPLANAGLDQDVEQGRSVVLDATGSSDPDGAIASYTWKITVPDGSTATPRCGTCPRTRFDAEQRGRYEVTVEVVDDDGVSRKDTLYVDVGPDRGASLEKGAGSDSPAGGATGSDANPSRNVGAVAPISSARQSCTSAEVRLGHDCVGLDIGPHVTISGPDYVGVGEAAELTTETHNFEAEKSYRWSTGGRGSTTSPSWQTPGVREVVVVVSDDAENSAVTQTWIHVVENKPPTVQIADVGNISVGDDITLSTSVKEDPDGEVVNTEWSPSSAVTVPTNDSVAVSVTITDNDGATASDIINLRGETRKVSVRATVFCYYTQESQKNRGRPHHCEEPDATKDSEYDGFSTAPAGFNHYKKSDQFSIAWKKVPEEELNPGNPGQVEGRPSDIDETSYPTTGYESTSVDAVERKESTDITGLGPFTLNGETVHADITGDGEINAVDWDQRYGSAEDRVDEIHEKAVDDLKNTHDSPAMSGSSSSSDRGSKTSESTDSTGSDSSASNSTVAETDDSHQGAVDSFKDSQRSNSSPSANSSTSPNSHSSSSSSRNSRPSWVSSSGSSSSSSNSSSHSSGGQDVDIDYTGGLGETSKGGTGHATHGI